MGARRYNSFDSMDTFKLTYRVEPSEVPEIVHYLWKHSPRVRRLTRFRLLFMGIAWVGLTLYKLLAHSSSNLTFAGILLVVFGLTFVLSVWIDRWWWTSQARGSRLFMASREMTLDPERLTIHTDSSETHLKWGAIHHLDSTPHFFYLFIDPNSALTIPRRAFPSDAEAERFRQMVQAFCLNEKSE
jgi:hypothetical protein